MRGVFDKIVVAERNGSGQPLNVPLFIKANGQRILMNLLGSSAGKSSPCKYALRLSTVTSRRGPSECGALRLGRSASARNALSPATGEKVLVEVHTKDVKGLTINDFILATKIEADEEVAAMIVKKAKVVRNWI